MAPCGEYTRGHRSAMHLDRLDAVHINKMVWFREMLADTVEEMTRAQLVPETSRMA